MALAYGIFKLTIFYSLITPLHKFCFLVQLIIQNKTLVIVLFIAALKKYRKKKHENDKLYGKNEISCSSI